MIYGKGLDDSSLTELVKDYVENGVGRDRIIESQIQLALSIVKQKDELVGEALLELVRAVDRFPKVYKDHNIGAFIRETIRLSIKRYVIRNKQYLPLIDVPDEREVNRYIENDFLEKVIRNDMDRKILKMRIARYRGQEIANELNVKVTYVWKRLHLIREMLRLHLED